MRVRAWAALTRLCVLSAVGAQREVVHVSVDFIARIGGMVVFLVAGIFGGLHLAATMGESPYRYAVIFMLVGALTGLVLTPYLTLWPFRALRKRVRRAPTQQLLAAATELEQRVRLGEAVRFPPGGDGEATVTRSAFVRVVDQLMATGLFRDRNLMLHRVEDELEIPRGRLTRLYRCRTFRWVPEQVQLHLEQLGDRCQYDPTLTYALGDRLVHHLFGPGTVEGKQPVDKIRVRFDDGTARILRVLAHPHRLKIIELISGKELTVGEVARKVGIPPNACLGMPASVLSSSRGRRCLCF